MTVRDCTSPSSCSGINASTGASLTLNSVTSSGHRRRGVLVFDNGFARITGGTFTSNGRDGILITDGSRGRISGATITDNDRHGVNVSFGSSLNLSNSTITNNDRNGVNLTGNSTGEIDGNTISGNIRRSIGVADNGHARVEANVITSDIPDSAPDRGGILVNRNGILFLGGGNTITNTTNEAGGGVAITLLAGSFLRQGDPGHDTITSVNGLALDMSNQSQAELRNFTLSGDISVNRHGLLRMRKDTNGVVNGDIEIRRDSAVSFALAGSGSVAVNGAVTCLDAESSADFAGQTAVDIVGGDGSAMDCSGYGPGNSQP
jgi:parallel beta-helix repeat protein